MIRQQLLFAGLFVVAIGAFTACGEVVAGDYVWARSPWGNGSWGRNYSGMTNGYGGYYVPRNAYGNNHESRPPYRNPNGYIVPAQTGGYTMTRQGFFHSATVAPQVQTSAAVPQTPVVVPNQVTPSPSPVSSK